MTADLRAQLALAAELHPDSSAALLLDALDHGAADTSRVPQEHCPQCGGVLDEGLVVLGTGESVCGWCAEQAWGTRYGHGWEHPA